MAEAARGAGLTIKEAAARTGISTHTLRYYERIGLVSPVARAGSGHRRYAEADLRWLEFLKKLHATDMSIKKMLEYARLARRGGGTMRARRDLLDRHREDVEAEIEKLRSSLGVIKKKVALYDRAIREGRTDLAHTSVRCRDTPSGCPDTPSPVSGHPARLSRHPNGSLPTPA
jgi:DNA-binding transcriptional MerR regulator